MGAGGPQRILRELPNSAVFGRALPRERESRSSCRGRAAASDSVLAPAHEGRDLLVTVRNVPDFPIMAETTATASGCHGSGHLDGLLTGSKKDACRFCPSRPASVPTRAGCCTSSSAPTCTRWDTPKAEQQLSRRHAPRAGGDLLEGSESGVSISSEAIETVVEGAPYGGSAQGGDRGRTQRCPP